METSTLVYVVEAPHTYAGYDPPRPSPPKTLVVLDSIIVNSPYISSSVLNCKPGLSLRLPSAQDPMQHPGKRAQKHTPAEMNPNVPKLAQMVETKLLSDLEASINASSDRATFACGGSIRFADQTDTTSNPNPTTSSIVTHATDMSSNTMQPTQLHRPVDIRFGPNGDGVLLRLPEKNTSSQEFHKLLAACQPASFGLGNKNVLDEEYRKAGKLDCTDFATTFCPYAAGIVDLVTQLLVPHTNQTQHFGVRVSGEFTLRESST